MINLQSYLIQLISKTFIIKLSTLAMLRWKHSRSNPLTYISIGNFENGSMNFQPSDSHMILLRSKILNIFDISCPTNGSHPGVSNPSLPRTFESHVTDIYKTSWRGGISKRHESTLSTPKRSLRCLDPLNHTGRNMHPEKVVEERCSSPSWRGDM